MKNTLPAVLLCLVPIGLLPLKADAVQATLEASVDIKNGCSFSAPGAGTLGYALNTNTLSTELTGGKRPELTVNVVGTAVLSQPAGITWTLDNALLSSVTTTHSLKTALNGGTAQSLPITFTTSGPRTYYLEITGTRPTEFFVAGNYKASATFTCT